MLVQFYRGNNTQFQNFKNFKFREFECKCGKCKTQKIDTAVVNLAQMVRNHFNKSVIVNSAYRCDEHNKNIGGAKNSNHTKGTALDIVVKGIDPLTVARYCEYIGAGGVGLYSWGVHIDTRAKKYFWIDGKGQVISFLEQPNTVEFLQIRLNHEFNEKLRVDGNFGKDTKTAVLKHFAK